MKPPFKPAPDRGRRIALQQSVCVEKRVFIDPFLEVMGEGETDCSPEPERVLSVLKDPEDQSSRIHEFCEKKEIKFRIRFLLCGIICLEKTDRFLTSEDQLCGGGTGERQ